MSRPSQTAAPGKGLLARRNVSTAALQQSASVLSAFIRIPLLLHTLGPARYGVWLGVFAAAGLSTISDFGIQLAVTQRVAQLRGEGRLDEVRQFVATGFWMSMVGFSLVAIGIVAWVVLGSPFAHQAAAAGVSASQARTIVLLACFASFALQPPRVVVAGQYGFERMYALNLCDVAGMVVNLAGLWLLSGVLGPSLLGLGAWTILCDLAFGLAVAMTLAWRHSEHLSIRPTDVRRANVRPLLRDAAAFFFGTVANTLRWNLDGVIILSILGPTFVTQYEPSMRLFLAGLTVVHLVFGTLWPSFAESTARADWRWVDRTFGVASISVLSVATLLFVLMQVFGESLLLRWVGAPGFSSRLILFVLAAWFLLSAWVLITAHMTISFGRAPTVTQWGLIEGFVNIILTIVFAHAFGLVGVALASLIAVLFFGVIPLTLNLRALTEGRIALPGREMLRLGAVALIGAATGFLLPRQLRGGLATITLIPAVCAAALLTTAAIWFLVFPPAAREVLLNQFRLLAHRTPSLEEG